MGKYSKKMQISKSNKKHGTSNQLSDQNSTSTDSRLEHIETGQGKKIAPNEKVIPVIEEQVHIEKRIVETGKVRVSKNVKEDEVLIDIPLIHDEVDVQRVPIDQFVEEVPPPVRYEGNKMIISVLREEVVLVKRIKLVEELHIINRKVEEHRTESINLRKEEVNIEHLRNDKADLP
jgi:uncharacterized protein (TIGR02271 family)